MDNLHITLFIIIGLLIIKIVYDNFDDGSTNSSKENIANIRPDRTVYDPAIEKVHHVDPPVGFFSTGELGPWWNATRHTRNMSYDLRGDVYIRPYDVGPWYNSPLIY